MSRCKKKIPSNAQICHKSDWCAANLSLHMSAQDLKLKINVCTAINLPCWLSPDCWMEDVKICLDTSSVSNEIIIPLGLAALEWLLKLFLFSFFLLGISHQHVYNACISEMLWVNWIKAAVSIEHCHWATEEFETKGCETLPQAK